MIVRKHRYGMIESFRILENTKQKLALSVPLLQVYPM